MAKKNTTPTVIDITTELTTVATESGMQLTEAQNIGAAFAPFMEKVNELTIQINSIPTENPSVADEALARKLRLELVSNRGKNGLAAVHKDFKAAVMVRQRAIDGLNNFVENSSKIAELRAEGIEKHSERMESIRLDALESEPLNRLTEIESEPKYGVNIRLMDDETFEGYFNNEKLIQDAVKRDNEAREELERKAASLVKDRTKMLTASGAKFDGEVFTIGTINLKVEALSEMSDSLFDTNVKNVKSEVTRLNKIQADKDAELLRLRKVEDDRKALLLSRFNIRSLELIKIGFAFVATTKMFTQSESAHDNIPSSTIVNMEDKPWKEYLKSVLDAIEAYREQVKVTDDLTKIAKSQLIAIGFKAVESGYQNSDLDWFIGTRHFDGFRDEVELNDWLAQQQLQHAKLTQAKVDADKLKANKAAELDKANKAAALLKEPDLNQARAFYAQLNLLKFPSLKSVSGKTMEAKVNKALDELKKLIVSEAKNLV